MERIASFTENKKGNAVKVVSEACPHSSKADAREEKKIDMSSCKSYIWTKKKKKKQQFNERRQLVPKKQLGCLQ